MKDLKRRFTSFLASLGGSFGMTDVRRELERVRQTVAGSARATHESQILLKFAYQQKKAAGGALPGLDDVEFRAYSQNGEDGILWYIFSLIGAETKTVVEICAGDGIQCNAANLLVNHGWTGLLIDGDEGNVATGRAFYQNHLDTFTFPPRFLHAWVDADNVNRLLTNEGFDGEIDLLSLDIDGIDYWLWQAMTAVRPRAVVAEVQAIWGDSRAVTVPYRTDFRAEYVDGFGIYCGRTDGATTGHVDIRKPFTVEVEYRILEMLPQFRIGLQVITPDGTIPFTSADSADPSYETKKCSPGHYTTRCFVPGNLLNEGFYSLTLGADIPLEKILFLEKGVMGFSVERTGGVSTRFPEKWPGVICPQPKWQTEMFDNNETVVLREA